MSKVGEGRTSDLIKRFESLALDSKTNGPPIRMPKRLSATTSEKPTTLATATEGTQLPRLSSDSQPHQISTSVSAALMKDGQEEPDTPPAHMAKPAGAATSSIQDLMTISSYSYTHANSAASTPTSATGAASANSPRQPERRQSLMSGRSRSNTAESVSRVSQSEGQQQRKVSNPLEPRQKTLITALNRRANIDASIQASSRSWLNSAERRIDEARLDVDSGDLENAYLRFMIACNILSEKIPKQKDFDSVRKDPKYVRLHKDISTYVLDELEKLAVELRKRPYVEPKRSVLTPEQVEKMESSFAQKFPENPLSSPLVSGSISAAAAAAAAAAQPSLSDNKWLAARHSTFDEIDAQARRIDTSAHQFRANDTGAVVSGVPGISRNQSNGINTMTTNSPTDGADYVSRVGKATIEYFDPNATTCTPKELWGLLEQSRTGVNGRPTVLILDIRPHQDYVWGHIDHRHIVNVDPIGLDKQKCTSKEIASSLVLVSEEQQLWFRQRDDFDIVVYASQAARSFSDSRSTELPALESVNSAIYHYEFDKPLKRSPLFLIGGFDAWVRAMGSEWCVWSDDARKSFSRASDARVAKNPKMRVTPQPEVTPYGASNYTPYYPPAAAAAVALPANVVSSTDTHAQPGVAGSVFDFFQQSNGYHPQLQQPGDGRYAPMHTSYTQGYNVRMTPRVPVPETGTAHLVSSVSSDQHIATSLPITDSSYQKDTLVSTTAAAAAVVGNDVAATNSSANPPVPPPKPASLVSEVTAQQVQRRKTIFDNPNYGFTAPAHAVASDSHEQSEATDSAAEQREEAAVGVSRKRRVPPKAPLPTVPQVMEKPAEYSTQQQQQQQQLPTQDQSQSSRVSKAGMPPPPPPPGAFIPPKPLAYVQQQQQQQQQLVQQQQFAQQQQLMQMPRVSNGYGFYNHPAAAGSDPSLNGRMHAGNNLRSSILYQTDILPQAAPVVGSSSMQDSVAGAGYFDSPSTQVKRRSQLSDTAAYGATGLKNFGNTCFMNCVIQCLVGTAPFARYFMQGGWKKDLVRSNGGKSDVAVEFARLVDNMWRGQYGSISPIGFRSSVAKCSEVFKGNDQEDAQEFATFLLDTIHESLNRVQKRRPSQAEEKQLSQEEEMQFEALPDAQQADIQWGKYIRRNWSIMTSIFQGQTQSRLTCMTCKHTSTKYDTFTELSVQIPTADTVRGAAAAGGKTLVRKSAASSSSSALNSSPFNIYQCLDAFSKAEILDGDDKWHCPKCKTRRRATKRLLVSRLPLVLIVHLKRFLTIGHFREKLENNILFPTRNLYMDRYTIPNVQQQTGGSTCYNLYGVANHFGTLSGGHYTASVFNGLRGQWNYFDDTRVSTIPEANVATPAAYLLFFVQSQQ